MGFLAQNKTSLKFAGLASLATSLVTLAISQLVTIQLNFWMLLVLLILGISVFIYIDLTGKRGGTL